MKKFLVPIIAICMTGGAYAADFGLQSTGLRSVRAVDVAEPVPVVPEKADEDDFWNTTGIRIFKELSAITAAETLYSSLQTAYGDEPDAQELERLCEAHERLYAALKTLNDKESKSDKMRVFNILVKAPGYKRDVYRAYNAVRARSYALDALFMEHPGRELHNLLPEAMMLYKQLDAVMDGRTATPL